MALSFGRMKLLAEKDGEEEEPVSAWVMDMIPGSRHKHQVTMNCPRVVL